MEKSKEMSQLIEEHGKEQALDLYVEIPCLLKQGFKNSFQRFDEAAYEKTGKHYYAFIPMTGHENIVKEGTIRDIEKITDEENLPDIAIDFAFTDFQSEAIKSRFVETDTFQNVKSYEDLDFINAEEFNDRNDSYNTIRLFPLVMVVDKKKLGDLPVPGSFEELLDPMYKGCICVPNTHHDLDMVLLHQIYKLFGQTGLEQFFDNVGGCLSTTEAARRAKRNAADSFPIFFAPWAFARGAVTKEQIEIVWPKEGNVAIPLLLMVKKNLREENKALLDFVLSEEIGQVFADKYFISTHKDIDNHLPENGKLSWLGWDYVYDNDLEALEEKFRERLEGYS